MQSLLMPAALDPALTVLIGFGLGVGLTAIVMQAITRAKSKTLGQELQRQIDGAKREAENIIKSAQSRLRRRRSSRRRRTRFVSSFVRPKGG